MSIESSRRSIPLAPEAVKQAIHSFKERSFIQDHESTIEYVNSKISPLLDALSVSEHLPSSSFFGTTRGWVTSESLWRLNLSYTPKVEVGDGKHVSIGVIQLRTDSGRVRSTTFQTGQGPSNVDIAYLGWLNRGLGVDLVLGPNRNEANKKELAQIEELANLVAEEAPKQAVENRWISPNWMERWNMDEDEVRRGFPFSERFPSKAEYVGTSPTLYEVLTYQGKREVCKVIKNGVTDPRTSWLDDVNETKIYEESEIAAWRQLLREPFPRYYSQAKYPRTYKDSSESQASV